MKDVLAELKSRNFLAFILVLQFIVYALVLFDIQVARQIIGFLYFTTIPGFIIVKLLKLNELDMLDIVLFSVGFSVAFLMLAGLFINELCFLFSVSKPLSLMPLMVILNSFILTGAFVVFLRNEGVKFREAKTLGASPLGLLLMGLPILSIVGAMWVNSFGNNLILLFSILAISLLFVIGIISKELLPPKLYPLAVLIIAISLLYHSSLISNYLVGFGSDISDEYFMAQTTINNARWSSVGDPTYGRLNSMLSITILPTVYSTLLNMSATQVFKILGPLIFSFVPLGLYQVWQRNVGKKSAFIAAFLLMAQQTFYSEMLGLTRQMVAELFFVLVLLTVLNTKMRQSKRIICFVTFSAALVMSHYALALVFLFFISLALISLLVIKRSSRSITATMVVLFFIVMFSWYIYTSNAATFDSVLTYGDYVHNQLGQFFSPVSRGQTVLRGLGMESPPSIWNAISRAFAYLTQFLIVVGFIGLVTGRMSIHSAHMDRERLAFTSLAMVLLAMCLLLPAFAETLNMTRFYHILLFFLAPLCTLGAEVIVQFPFKRKTELKASILLLAVLTPYFLFQTGLVYEVTGTESWSLPLSMHRMDVRRLYRSLGYIDEWSVFGARWMRNNVDVEYTQIYGDASVFYVLIGYGMMYGRRTEIEPLFNTTTVVAGGTVFLTGLNVINGIITVKSWKWNTTELSPVLNCMNKMYSNGGCEIYKNVVEL